MKKLKSSESSEKSEAFSPQNIMFLNQVFGKIRYVLTRFGRIINFFDAMHSFYKRKQFAVSSKQAPAIRKIQQESLLSGDSD